ncbi:ATP-dependent Clp protease ATP-binding subunit ClpA, partial [Pseudomonas aeruginosa]|nr:ATP-dependent Clp protease ATP-binding subunit ClpA [Pseudomonas aeruginosa]
LIGATTLNEYQKYIEKDAALERRFQPVMVPEPTVAQTMMILRGLRDTFEAHHKVSITEDAIIAAAELSDRYITARFLPDKAIDVIDEAGARQRLLPEGQRKELIDVEEVEAIVAKMARIPTKQVSATDKDVLQHLERNLKMVIFGQDPAIETLSSAIKLA